MVAELCDPAVEVVAGAEEEDGDDALGVTAGAFEKEEEEGDDALGVTAGAFETEEEGKDTLGVGAVEADGARVTAGVGVTDALGDPSLYVTFLTTPRNGSLKKIFPTASTSMPCGKSIGATVALPPSP